MIPRAARKAWEVADEQLRHHRKLLEAAQDPIEADRHQRAIDGWLDYRLEHGPEDTVKS